MGLVGDQHPNLVLGNRPFRPEGVGLGVGEVQIRGRHNLNRLHKNTSTEKTGYKCNKCRVHLFISTVPPPTSESETKKKRTLPRNTSSPVLASRPASDTETPVNCDSPLAQISPRSTGLFCYHPTPVLVSPAVEPDTVV